MAHRKAPPGTHRVRDHKGTYRTIEIDHLLRTARSIAIEQLAQGPALTSPADTKRYLENALGSLKYECFVAVFLDTRHQVIGYEELFHGTIDGATVYPRVVAEKALACGAAALIVAHNHPSGVSEPSLADQAITRRLKDALALLDIRLLDHFVVGKTCVSFAERGLL